MLYEQLAERTPDALVTLLSEAGLRAQRVETWPAQAALAAQGNWDALDTYRN
jgi:hypothetical protein